MDTELLKWTIIAIVGTVGVIKNFVNKGGKKTWTAITLGVGVVVAVAAMHIPIKALQVWVAVVGATLFYDTIFKAFQKGIEVLAKSIGGNTSSSEPEKAGEDR